jgi:hypothetical protein
MKKSAPPHLTSSFLSFCSMSVTSNIVDFLRDQAPKSVTSDTEDIINVILEEETFKGKGRYGEDFIVDKTIERYLKGNFTKPRENNGYRKYGQITASKGIKGLITELSNQVTPIIGVENFGLTDNFNVYEITIDSRFRNANSFAGANNFKVKIGSGDDRFDFAYIPFHGGFKSVVKVELIDATFPNLLATNADDSYRNEPYFILVVNEVVGNNYTNKQQYFGKVYQDPATSSTDMFGKMDPTRKSSIEWPISHPHSAITELTVNLLNPQGGTVSFGTDAQTVATFNASSGPSITTITTSSSHGFSTGDKLYINGRAKAREALAGGANEFLSAFNKKTHTVNVTSLTAMNIDQVYNGNTTYESDSNMEIYAMNLKRQVTMTFKIWCMRENNTVRV